MTAVSNPYPYRFQDKRRFRSNKNIFLVPVRDPAVGLDWTGLDWLFLAG